MQQDVAIVFVNADLTSMYMSSTIVQNVQTLDISDRQNLTLWLNADNLINAVAALNNTIVVVLSVGPVILEPWNDNPNVTAVVWANLPGQESGNSLVNVLYGDVNPSGKLPCMVAKSADDYPAGPVTGGTEDDVLLVEYTQGVNIDYRHFDAVSTCRASLEAHIDSFIAEQHRAAVRVRLRSLIHNLLLVRPGLAYHSAIPFLSLTTGLRRSCRADAELSQVQERCVCHDAPSSQCLCRRGAMLACASFCQGNGGACIHISPDGCFFSSETHASHVHEISATG